VAIRDRTVCALLPGLFAATMTATTTGPKPAVVSAEAAARCPARHASSLRIVDGMRIPAKMFLGNRPVAAICPSATTITPPNPSRIAFNTQPAYNDSRTVSEATRNLRTMILEHAQ